MKEQQQDSNLFESNKEDELFYDQEVGDSYDNSSNDMMDKGYTHQREPNRQPLDGDYFTLENLAEYQQMKKSQSENEFRYHSIKEDLIRHQKEKTRVYKKKSFFSDLFKPTYEEFYSLDHLDSIQTYDQFSDSVDNGEENLEYSEDHSESSILAHNKEAKIDTEQNLFDAVDDSQKETVLSPESNKDSNADSPNSVFKSLKNRWTGKNKEKNLLPEATELGLDSVENFEAMDNSPTRMLNELDALTMSSHSKEDKVVEEKVLIQSNVEDEFAQTVLEDTDSPMDEGHEGLPRLDERLEQVEFDNHLSDVEPTGPASHTINSSEKTNSEAFMDNNHEPMPSGKGKFAQSFDSLKKRFSTPKQAREEEAVEIINTSKVIEEKSSTSKDEGNIQEYYVRLKNPEIVPLDNDSSDADFEETSHQKDHSELSQKVDLSQKIEQLGDEFLSETELEDLGDHISQSTLRYEAPIITDAVLEETLGQDDLRLEGYVDNVSVESQGQEKESNFVSGAAWLTVGNIISRIIGALYVIPWATWLGQGWTQGNTLYSVGYKPYSLFLAIATAGFPSAIAKQMALHHSQKEYRAADKLFKNSILVMLVTGLVAGGLLYIAAPVLAEQSPTVNIDGAILVIRSLVPALIILPVMSLLRGYFQGFNDMRPTAISQILEQFARVGYMLAATYAIMMIYHGEVTQAVVHSTFAAFIGAVVSLAYLIIVYLRRLPKIKQLIDQSEDNISLDFKRSLGLMVTDSIPFIILGSGIIIAQLIDTYTFSQILKSTSILLLSEISEMYGVLSLDVDKLIMIIISLAVALSTAFVPSLTSIFAKKDIKGTSNMVRQILTVFTMVMVPSAIGMAAIADNVYWLFYPQGSEIGPSLLVTASLTSIVLGLYTVLSTILQSMNFRRVAVRFLIVGLVVKALIQFPLVAFLQAHGAILSTTIGLAVSSLFMWIKLRKELEIDTYRLTVDSVKIIIPAIFMGIAAMMWNNVLNIAFGPVGRLATFGKILLVVLLSIIIYGGAMAVQGMLPILIGNKYPELQKKLRIQL